MSTENTIAKILAERNSKTPVNTNVDDIDKGYEEWKAQNNPSKAPEKQEDITTLNSEISSLSNRVKEYDAIDSGKNNSRATTTGMYSGGMSVLDAVKPLKETNDKYTELSKTIVQDRERLAELSKKRDAIISGSVDPIIQQVKSKKTEISDQLERSYSDLENTLNEEYDTADPLKALEYEKKRQETTRLIERKQALTLSEDYLVRMKDLANVSPDKYIQALGQGFANHDWVDIATLGLKSMEDNFNLASISKKIMAGTATEEEKVALTLYSQFNQLAATKDKPVTYDIAQSFIQSLPYMADIAISGGVRGAITKGITKGIGRTVVNLSDNVAGIVANKTAQKAVKGTIKNTAKIATQATGAIASSPLQMNMYNNFSENRLANYVIDYDNAGEVMVREAKDSENVAESMIRAMALTASATFSESSGVIFDDAFSAIGKKFSLNKLNPHFQNSLSRGFGAVKKATSLNQTFGEVGEEYINKFTDILVTNPREEDANQDEWANFFNTREGLTILGSTLITQGMFKAQYAPHLVDLAKTKSIVKENETLLPEEIRAKIVQAMSAKTANEQVDGLVNLKLGSIENPEERRSVVNYIKSKIEYDFVKGVAQGDQEIYRIRKVDDSVASIAHKESGKVVIVTETNQQDPNNEAYVIAGNIEGEKTDLVTIITSEGEKKMVSIANLSITNTVDVKELRDNLVIAELSKLEQETAQEEGIEKAESLGINAEEVPSIGEELPLPDGSTIKIVSVDTNGVSFDVLDAEGIPAMTKSLSFEEYSQMVQPTAENQPVEGGQPVISEQDTEQAPISETPKTIKTLTDGKHNLSVALDENNEGISQEVYDNLPDAEKVVNSLSKRFSKLEFNIVDQSGDDVFSPDAYVISVKPRSVKSVINQQANETIESAITPEESITPEAVVDQVSEQAEEGQIKEVTNEQDIQGQQAYPEIENQEQVKGEEIRQEEGQKPIGVDELNNTQAEELIPVDDSSIGKLNEEEIALVQSKLDDPDEPQDQKEYWVEDIEKLKTNPKKYWSEFLVQKGNTAREDQILSIQDYYNNKPIIQDLDAHVSEIDKKAEIQSEEKKVNIEPTEAQKEAGNYKKGHVTIGGFDITIENPKGSFRKGKDRSGKEWKVKMNNTYGYFKRTKGKDGEQIDVFLGENPETGRIFVVDQLGKSGKLTLFDEHKVMMGFKSEKEAKEAYKSNYSKDWDGFGAITEMSREEFKAWIGDGTRTKNPVEWKQKQKKSNPNAFLPKQAIELLKSDPNSIDEAIIQHILNGGKFSRNDYIRHSGFMDGSKELNTASFNGLINGKDQEEGMQFDTFLGTLGNDFGMNDGIDLTNAIVDVLKLSTRANLARRLIEASGTSQDNHPHLNDDYAQGLAEQEEALRLAEDELMNEVAVLFYSNYPQITNQEYAELFNFGENEYNEQRNEPTAEGDIRTVQGETGEDGGVDNAGDRQDETGSVPGIEVDGRTEGEGSAEVNPQNQVPEVGNMVESQEVDRVPDTKETIETTKKTFLFMSDSPMHQARALGVLTRNTKVDGVVMPIYQWIEGLPSGLGVGKQKIYTKNAKSDDGSVEKLVLGNYIVGSKAEQDYYNYIQTGGVSYTQFLADKKVQDEIIAEKKRIEKEAQDKIFEDKRRNDNEAYKKAKEDQIKELIEKGKQPTIDKFTESFKNKIKQLQSKPQTSAVKEEIAYNNRMIEQTISQVESSYDIATTMYEVIEGEVKPKYTFSIGDKVLFPATIDHKQTLIETVIESSRSDNNDKIIFKVAKKEGIVNPYSSYDGLRPVIDNDQSSPENKNPENVSNVDAIKSVISLQDEQETTISRLKSIAAQPQKTAKDNQDKTQLEYKLGQIEEKLNKAQALVNIPAEKLPAVTKLVRQALAEEKAIDARIESLNSQKKNKEKEFNTRNGVFGDNKEIADKAKGQQSLFAGDIFEASTNTLANTIKPINDSIAKLEEEKQRNAKILTDKVELELQGAQQEIKEEVKAEPKGDLFLKASEIIETSPKGRVLSDINELIHTAKNIQQLKQLLELPYIKQTFGLVQEVNSAINYLERHPEKQEQQVNQSEKGDFDFEALFEETPSNEVNGKQEPDNYEDWYQNSSFSKKWAATRAEAIEKVKQTYINALRTKNEWESKDYKNHGGSVEVGKNKDDFDGGNVGIDYINNKRKKDAISNAISDTEQAITDLKSLKLSQSEIDNFISSISKAEQPKVKPEFAGSVLETESKTENKTYSIPETFNLSTFSKFSTELSNGNVQVDDFKKAFNVLIESKASIIEELSKKTKAELLANMNSMGQYRYKNENKDSIVKALFSDMLMTFSFGSISYNMGETIEQAITKKVDATTQEQINDYVDETKKRREEYLERVKAHKKALSNPETLEEFKVFIKYNGIEKLSPEQKATYDDLVTDKVLENRSDDAKKGAIVEKVDLGDTEMSIAETKHTKTGIPLFVVRLSARIPEEQYKELNKKAKQLGGYYSSYAKDGAIPGFQFKTLEQAQAFSGLKTQDASNIDIKEEVKEQKVEQKISKLRENAQKIIERVDSELNRDRLTNTAKRAREAASTEARLNEEKRIAQTMLNIADAIENGDVKLLDGIKAKTHIELLDNLIKSAKYAEISSKAESYSDRQKYEGEPATLETIEYLKNGFYPSIYGTTLKDVINKVENKPGLKQLATKWSKKLSGLGEYDSYQVTNDTDISEIEQLFNGLSESDKKYNRIGTVLADFNRLKTMGIENDSMLRAALREYIQFRGKKQAPDKVKELERAIVGRAKNLGVDFFPTPAETAKMMVELAGVTEDMEILEPSAGNGNIADQIKQVGVMPDVIEISSELSEILKAKGYDVVADDFMEYTEKKYDRIIMNPPFSNGMDGDHVKHAYEILKPGGKLVAIVGEGTFIRNDKKATAFREWLEEVGGNETKLESGTFQDKTLLNTTGANARIVVIEKEGEFIDDTPDETVDKQEVVNENVSQDKKEVEQEQLEAVEPINDIQDFGEKVGGARKDMGITRTAREKDSMPAWRRKYEYANPNGTVMLIGKVDTSKPFIVNFFEEVKGMMGKHSRQIIVSEVKDGYITRNPMIFSSEEEAENYIPIYEVHRQGYKINQKGDEFVIYKRASTGKALEFDKFPTIEDAQAYINSTEGATSLLNRKRESFSIPSLERVQRTGKDYRQGKNISTDEFYNTFGFRGGEFGKWVKPEERQALLNIAYDSLMDMANLLNLPPKALSLNGELSIAFGARGIGGLEGGVKAHYEGNRAVINMTRLNGAGSLAHEWMHALDNYFGLQDAKQDYSRDDKGELISKDYFFSEVKTYKAGMRPELKKALEEILDNLVKKTVTRDIAQDAKQKLYDGFERSILGEADRLKAKLNNGVRTYKYNRKTKQREEVVVKATAEQLEKANALIDKITSGNSEKPKWQSITANSFGDYSYISDDIRALDEIYKSVFGGTGLKRNGNGYYNFGYYAEKLYHIKEELEKAKNGEQETVKIKTDLLDSSSRFDASRVSPYYSKPIEMLARAFEQYMVTKLGTEKSDYLQYDKSPVYKALYDITPYPEGEELETLNKAFDNLFSAIKTEEREDGNVVMFKANNPTFYPNAEKSLESLSDNNRTPEQWRAELLKNGAKESELNYMGWSQFVEGKRTLTKNDLTEFVNSNKVEVQEVVKQTEPLQVTKNDALKAELVDDMWYVDFGQTTVPIRKFSAETKEEAIEQAVEEYNENIGEYNTNGNTKFAQYSTPGGKNYREVLLTLPSFKLPPKADDKLRLELLFEKRKRITESENPDQEQLRIINDKIEIISNRIDESKDFRSSHFNEPNIAAHVRLSEFTDKQGRRVLLVDEVQSDWAQKGKKEGFKVPAEFNEEEFKDWYERVKTDQEPNYSDLQNDNKFYNYAKQVFLDEKQERIDRDAVPDMPFKKTDQWVGLGMKWAIQYAAKNGFDGVAWTTGEQQAERYDLSKQVDSIATKKERNGLYTILGNKNGKHVFTQIDIPENKLEGIIGKDLAKKIIDYHNEVSSGWHSFSGIDLQIGDEGMVAFYDNIIPSWVNKYAKKFDTKTTTTEIDTTPDIVEHGIDLNTGEVNKTKEYKQVHYLPISDSMVKTVMNGQPMFRSAGDVLNNSESERKFLAVQSEFNRIAELSNGAITAELVRTVDELPEVLRRNGISEKTINAISEDIKKSHISGFFLRGKAYVISDNAIDAKEAVRTLIHERGVHGGIRILIPDADTRLDFLERVYESIGEEAFNKMLLENGGHPDQYKEKSNWEKGEEYLAFLSEKIITEKDLTPKERGVWEWLKNYINNLVGKVLRFDVNSIKFTDKELAHIVRASVSANHVTTNIPSGRGRAEKETSPSSVREENRNNSVLEGSDRGDDVHDNVQYPDSRRSRCLQHIKDALGKEQLNNLPYNHGTGIKFDRFDIGKVGAGTGEKIHGFGLYFNITTLDKEVGKSYARMNTLYTPQGIQYMNDVKKDVGALAQSYLNKAFLKHHGRETKESTISALKKLLELASTDNAKTTLSSLIAYVESKPFPNDRYLVTGTIKSNRKDFNFLSWNEPLFKDQWDAIINRLKVEQFNENEFIEKIANNTYAYNIDTNTFEFNDPTGMNAYRALSEVVGGDEIASNLLSRAGIDGTIYFDNTVNDGNERIDVCLFSHEGVDIEDTVMFRHAGEYIKGATNETDLSNLEIAQELIQDRMYSVRKLQDIISKRGGKIDDFSNVYILENLAASKADAAMDSFRNKQLKEITSVIAEIMSTTGATYQEVTDYMIAKHTPERNEYFREQGRKGEKFAGELNDKEAEDIVKAFEDKIGELTTFRLWDAIRKATNFTLDKYLEYGFINKADHTHIKARWHYYIPLRGWAVKDEIDSIWDYSDKESEGSLNLMKTAKGRTSKADNPLAHIISMAHSAIVTGEKNMIKQATFRLANNNKEMKDLFVPKKVYQVITGKDSDGKDIITEVYEKPEQKLFDEGKVITKTNRSHHRFRPVNQSKQNEVTAWVNGEKVVVVFDDPRIANAINYNNQWWEGGTRGVQDTIGRATRWLSANFTSKNPAFIPINLLRDLGYSSLSHAIRDDGNFTLYAKNMNKARKAIVRNLNGKFDPNNEGDNLYQQFLKHGGETGWVHLDNIDTVKKELLRDVNKLSKTSGFARRVLVDKIIKNAGKKLEHMAVFSENISRFATFLASVEAGKTYTKAAYDAKNISVNFNRKGRVTGFFGSLFAFFNASVQGGNNILSIANKNKGKFATTAALFYALGIMVAALHDSLEDDDEETYFDNSDYVRRNNLVLNIGNGKYLSLPLPHGFRGFYGLGDMTYSYMKGKMTAGNMVKDGLSAMVSNLSPVDPVSLVTEEGWVDVRPVIPTVFVPFYDIAMNADYSGRRVYREPFSIKEENIGADSQQYRKGVNPVLKSMFDSWFELGGGDPETKKQYYREDGKTKKVHELFDMNPSKAEHLLTYYLGGRGKFWTDAVTFSNNVVKETYSAAKENSTMGEAILDIYTGVDFNSAPVANRLIKEPYSYEFQKQYSKLKEEYIINSSLESTFKGLRRYEDAAEMVNEKRTSILIKTSEKRIKQLYDMSMYEGVTEKQYEEYMKKIDKIKKQTVEKINSHDKKSGRN